MSWTQDMQAAAEQAVRMGLTAERAEGLLLQRSLRDFSKAAWPQVENDELVWTWHNDAVCEHLEAVSAGEIEQLVINIPPGCSKSTTVSVLWEAWEWTTRPEGQWFNASYDQDLSTRDSVKCRNLIESRWYKERWGHRFTLAGDDNLKTYYRNTRKGWRMATIVGGHGTGEHPDRIVVDDPHDRERAFSTTERLKARTWWDQTMSTRGVARGVRKVIIMQRLHEEDLTAHVLKEGGWVHLMLPMRFEPLRRCVTKWTGRDGRKRGFTDPRKDDGELLAPQRYTDSMVRQEERLLGSFGSASQLQQRPSPAEGGLFKRKDWRFWAPAEMHIAECQMHARLCVVSDRGEHHIVDRLPEKFDDGLLSLDASFKDSMSQVREGRQPDPVSMGCWLRTGADFFLTDRENGIMSVGETAAAYLAMAVRNPHAKRRIIEDKANGPAVYQILRRKVPGLILATPMGSKVERVMSGAGATRKQRDARAQSTQSLHEAGNLHLPHPGLPACDWVWDVIEQFAAFPNVIHDDDVDMTSQAILRLAGGIWQQQDEAEREARKLVEEFGGQPPETAEELHRHRLWQTVQKQQQKAERRQRGTAWDPYARRR